MPRRPPPEPSPEEDPITNVPGVSGYLLRVGSTFPYAGRVLTSLIFDMDGVIADTREAHATAWVNWARRHGFELDRESFMRDCFGRSNMDILPAFFPDKAGDREFLHRVGEEKEEVFLAMVRNGSIPAVDGVSRVVRRAVARGLRLAVGSSAPRRNIDAVLGFLGLGEHFPVIVSQEDVASAKPAPDIFLECARRMKSDPRHCLVFEDSMHGLEAARRAEMLAVGLTTMHTAQELEGRCVVAVPDFDSLIQISEWERL